YRWTVLSAGVFAQAAYAATGLGLPAIAPAIRHDFGLTLTQTGVVLAAGFIGSLATLLVWGIVADVVGERVVIAVGQTMTAAAFDGLACGCVAAALVAAVLIRVEPSEDHSVLARPLRDPRVWRICIGSSFYVVTQLSLLGFFVLFLHDHRGISTATAAGALAV